MLKTYNRTLTKTKKKRINQRKIEPTIRIKKRIHSKKTEENVKDSKTIFDIGSTDPLSGTPKEVQEELDNLALHIQKHPEDDAGFTRIQHYINKYLLGLVFKKYSYVRGYDQSDMYQEALLALTRKAIPKFKIDKGMSFLNFAKMCINRHLITILHASKHRRKDMPINCAISIDHSPTGQEEDESCVLSNIIKDEKTLSPSDILENEEAFNKTLKTVMNRLSTFESIVLEEYLQEKSYKETAKNVTKRTGVKYNEKSVDNALLRIRKKAVEMISECEADDIPLLIR